jgi:nitrite reductase/ring-hydroxylating ferredoxin subunit
MTTHASPTRCPSRTRLDVTGSPHVVAVCAAVDLAREGKLVVDANGVRVLLMWNGGDPVALNDTCIHRARSLSDGVVFSGRLVCAGHQWAFDLHTGYCKARERYQPVYPLTIRDGTVFVDVPPAPELAIEDELIREPQLAPEH